MASDQLAPFVLKSVHGLDTGEKKGSGSYGVVYKVTVDGVTCIAKRLHDILVNPEVPRRQRTYIKQKFHDECVLLSQLRHPNIVHFVGVHYGSNQDDMSLIMECLDTDLARCLETQPNIPIEVKLSILLDVSYGLLYLHTLSPQKIIHRDLTAVNILLTRDKRAKIADLGVSKLLDPRTQATMRQTKAPGTIYYMPPEALQENPNYDETLDIFSFGHLALYVINQVFPEVYEVLITPGLLYPKNLQILKRQKAINEMGRGHCLHEVVTKCLQDDPKERPTTLKLNELLSHLCLKHPRQLQDVTEVEAPYSPDLYILHPKEKYVSANSGGKDPENIKKPPPPNPQHSPEEPGVRRRKRRKTPGHPPSPSPPPPTPSPLPPPPPRVGVTVILLVYICIFGACCYLLYSLAVNSHYESPVINCAALDHPKNGFVSSSSTVEGGTATYSCKTGFVLEGEDTRTCTSAGNWSGTEPTCRKVDCSRLKQLQGSTVSYDGTGYNMLVEYKCDEGFSLIGSSTRVCKSDGKWSGEEPVCEAVKCSVLEPPMNGKVRLQERTYRSKADYTCNDGFELVGDNYRICQADRSWSGNAPFCEFSNERRKDQSAFSIYQKISRIQAIAKQLESQTTIARALDMIGMNVADGRLQAGMVGLIKSGKSTTLNALMKTQILPEAIQPETAAEVHIIHSTRKEHKNGILLGDEDIEIATGSEKIHHLLRQYNEMARKDKRLPYDTLTLRIPLPFLKESVLKFSLEISDTAGPDEAGATDATLRSLSTMERLSVFIIVLNYRRMKSQQELDLLTHLRDHHPQLLETHERFLFIVNAIDAYYDDGNKYSIHPKHVHEYVQTYLQDTLHVTIPTERIVPFSAKWALQSHLWHEHPESISNADYMMAAGLSAKIQNVEPSKNMRIPSLENKKVVASHLKDFSGIRELEPKLYRMLGINGPVILYKGAIDDTIAHISTLKKHIQLQKERCDITGATATLQLHEQVSEALNQAISNSEQTMQNFAKELEDYSGRSILNWTFALQEELSEHIASLPSESQFADPEAISDQILKPADRIMEQTWFSIISNLTGELRRNVELLFSSLERRIKHIENTHNVKLKLEELNFTKLEKPPPFLPQATIPSSIKPITVSALKERDIGIEWAIHFRRNTEAEVSKLTMKNFAKAQKGCRTRVERIQNKELKKIERSRQVLETKQEEMESLNQKAYQLETVHRQLLVAREEFQMAEEETVEVKKVKPEDRKTSGTSSQCHVFSLVMLLLYIVVLVAYILLL